MFISLGVNAQTERKVVVTQFYDFEFYRGMSASVALNNGMYQEIGATKGKTEIIISEDKKTMLVEFDNNKYFYKLVNKLNNDTYIFYGPGEDGRPTNIQMSFVDGVDGRYLISESNKPSDKNRQKAWIAKIL